ncbi:MAG: hypothetical protein Q7R57_03520 [Dehalococcoidales bacterium]|nr:hypothetical protein [Dehalococcoidales bacterium]
MSELKFAITAVEALAAIAVVLVAGDYLGHKLGRMRLASYVLIGVIGIAIIFAIYAAIVLG